MSLLRRHSPRVVAVASLLLLYASARLPEAGQEERNALASRFRFESSLLPAVTPSNRAIRVVRPSLRPIDAWISSVGAAVALNDLDGDGLPNDVCYVDVRSDEVVLAPAPGTGARFAAFDLLTAPGCDDDATAAPMGAIPVDADEDGRNDVLVYFWGRSPLLYLSKRGPPSAASFDCREVLPRREDWYTNAALVADVDGDSHPDLIAGNYFPDGSRVLDPQSSAPAMSMQRSMSRATNGGTNRLLLWQSDPGRPYRDVPEAFPPHIARAWTLAIGAHDLDGDLRPELYFGNDFGADHLLANRSTPGAPRFTLVEGRRRFIDPRSKVLGRDSFKGMGIDFADLNDDAIPDLLVSNITDEYALEESNLVFVSKSRLQYHDEGEPLGLSRGGWAWDARFADFDNDGGVEVTQAAGFVKGNVNRWPELHELAMGNDDLLHRERHWPRFGAGMDLSGDNHNPFFVRARDGRYYDVAPALGMATPMVSRGIATADVDGDGRLDFAVANQWNASRFFRNAAPARRSLTLHLRLPLDAAPRTRVVPGVPAATLRSVAAIGASAEVRIGGKRLIGQVDGGNGHSGKRSHELHFGLGQAASADVVVSWRDRNGTARRESFRLGAGAHTLLLTNGRS